MTEGQLKFNAGQRQRALQLGFTEAQVDDIEVHALPAAANYFKELAPRDQVRKRITEVWRSARKRTMAERRDALARILRQAEAADAGSPLIAALNHLAQANYQRLANEGVPFSPDNAVIDGLAQFRLLVNDHKVMEAVAEAAKALVPREQRRRREADPGPARQILYVVEPWGVPLSTSPTSIFRGIVSLCYEVLRGSADATDAERAIKALSKWDRAIP